MIPRNLLQRVSFGVARRLPPSILQQTWPLFIKSAAILAGLSLFIPFIPPPVSLLSQLGHWETLLWGGMLITGGVCGIWGLMRDRWMVHIAGLVLIGMPLLVYAYAVYNYRGTGAFVNSLLLATLGVGSYTRALGLYVTHVTAELRLEGHRRAHEHNHEHPTRTTDK